MMVKVEKDILNRE